MIKKFNQKIKNILIKIHQWEQKQWLIVSIFLSTVSIWFSLVLNFWGEDLKLVVTDSNGKSSFTFLGSLITLIIVCFSSLFVLAQKYYEYYKLNSDTDKRKLFVLEQVSLATNKICDNKFITLKKQIFDLKNYNIGIVPKIVSKPDEQIKHIIEKMNNCLCKLLTGFREDELYISLYYNFPKEKNDLWSLADSLSPEKGLSITDLLNGHSTFNKVLTIKENFLFYNSKEYARRCEAYISDSEDRVDENNNLKGSIACYRIVIEERNQILIKAVISISTYNKRFVDSNDKNIIDNTKYNIEEHILKQFAKRINIELCLLYLSKL